MSADLPLDALEQALWAPKAIGKLMHHSEEGSQYLSIRYTERLADIGIAASVGSTGDAYDNAVAETINVLYKAELFRRQGSWKSREEVERTTLPWVHWFNTQRLHAPIGNIPPAEIGKAYYAGLESLSIPAGRI
jgi:transposase InsO family protein